MPAELSGSLGAVDPALSSGYRRTMHIWWFLLVVLGCGGSSVSLPPVDPTAGRVGAIGLAFRDPSALDQPQSSRSEGKAPRRWLVRGAWKKTREESGRVEYTTRAPYRLLFYGHQGGTKPKGMQLEKKPGGKVRFAQQKSRIGPAGTWGLRKGHLVIRVLEGEGPPKKAWVRVPGATKAERSMNMDTAGMTPQEFALRTVDRRKHRTHGLFLPAPGRAEWQLEVPRMGRLDLDAEVLRPPVRTQTRSDGAVVVVSVDAGTGLVEVLREELAPGKQKTLSASLAPWAGQTVTLQIVTEPGESSELDYVFLGDPVLHTPKEHPARALVVLVDTLRRDHLGLYGYDRPTSPVIDKLAEASLVFDQAWAPSPWTLPSSLAALYGRDPEIVHGHPHVGEQLGAEGWATCAVVSNNWLTGPDTLGSGWSQQSAHRGAQASAQAKRARKCLEKYPDRDALVFVHFIDPHLPYMEAGSLQGRFAGEAPGGLPKVIRHTHAKNAYADAKTPEERDSIRQHLIDRYDQNILAVDSAVGTLLKAVGGDATVALVSDHGEEFWEHGGFEHGHTLYDELMRVPLIIRTGGGPSRVKEPVQLIDIVPTLRELLSLPALEPWEGVGAVGVSLIPLFAGEDAAKTEARSRPIALGRVLFGDSHWGVIHTHNKWISAAGTEKLFHLLQDPAEARDLAPGADLSGWPGHLSEALHRPVERVLRIVGPGTKRKMAGGRSKLEVRHTAPIRSVWARLDPHDSLADPVLIDGVVRVATSKGQQAPRELFLQLAEGADPTGLEIRWKHKGVAHVGTVQASRAPGPLLTLGPPGGVLRVGWAWQPLPLQEGGVTYSGEVTEELRALGYVE